MDFLSEYYRLRRRALEKEYDFLNDMQKKACFAARGPLLVLAGAGSGKTTVLVTRIAYLLRYGDAYESEEIPSTVTPSDIELLQKQEKAGEYPDLETSRRLFAVDPVPPWGVLAITFTNKAAGEMKERIRRMTGEAADEIWASTFHSMCVRLLRRYADRIGFPSNFTIYDADDQLRLMKELVKTTGVQMEPKAALNEISRAKDALIGPEEFKSNVGSDYRLSLVSRIYTLYSAELRNANAMDFDDLIFNMVRILEENEDIRTSLGRRFRYILVDEYQDTNLAQYRLTSLLAEESGNLCVVGDDDQSIYRFRGATIRNILEFENEFPGARTVKLEQNYRSTSAILDAANAVISHNRGRKGKNLWTEKEGGEKILHYIATDESAEAGFVAEDIASGVWASAGRRWSDSAVLYRANAQSNALEQVFREKSIPYRIVGGTRFYDRAEIKDVLAYMQVLANPDDELRLMRIINLPTRGISSATLEKARNLAAEQGYSTVDVLRRAAEYPELKRPAPALGRFFTMMESLREASSNQTLAELYEEILETTGYRAMWVSKNDEDAQGRLENIEEMKSSLLTFGKNHPEFGPGQGLEEFLGEVALLSDIDRFDSSADAVTMMTVHNAKGLEFPSVYLVGMEEDIFPSFRSSNDPESLEEERRLCYVAITRAKEKLTILTSERRMLYGRTSCNPPSRFLEEIPPDLMNEKAGRRRYGSGRNTGFRDWGRGSSFHSPFSTNNEEDIFSSSVEKKQQSGGFSAARGITGHSVMSEDTGFSSPEEKLTLEDMTEGLRVKHKVFGEGTITSVLSTGGDKLIAVSFDDGSEKKFMGRHSIRFLTKVI